MVKRYIPHILGLGILALLFGFTSLQGTCKPSDTLMCNELRVNGNLFTLNGQMKQTIDGVNLEKYQPEVYIESGGSTTPLSCTKTIASFSKPNINIVLQCPTNLDGLKTNQALIMKWKVETRQPYSQQAVFEEEEWTKMYQNSEEKSCVQVGNELVCTVILNTKIPGSA